MGDIVDKDFGVLFRDIVAPHLHKIVDLISGSQVRKVLLHEWVLGIEYNWAEYFVESEVDSELIPRIAIGIGGLRDKFKNHPSEEEVIKMLIKVFDVSTLAYFEFGAKSEILWEINKFCEKTDKWMNKDILGRKFKRFKLIREPIPLINNSINTLKQMYPDLQIRIGIEKKLTTSSEIEKKITRIVHRVIELFIEHEKAFDDNFDALDGELSHLMSKLADVGYDKLLTEKQKEEIEHLRHEYQERKDRIWREKIEREQKEREEERDRKEDSKRNEEEKTEHKKTGIYLWKKIKNFFTRK